ncbi:hypothetical protein FJZ27_04755 [Candidatus Peribacteria bacterium]|nr:hypothetical protein [Candidatus Peribacteria bacterium]
MILFCASEAGGARELIPVIKKALLQNIPCRLFASSVTAPLCSAAGLSPEIPAITSQTHATSLLNTIRPEALILGTTGIISGERYLTAAARIVGIRSIAILDEWYNYALRFRDEQGMIGTYLPDVICVQDALSLKLAEEEGIPQSCMRITGSPALAELHKKADELRKHPPAVPEELQNNANHPSVLFLSEKLKAAYGERAGQKGTHGSFLGFHEDIVRDDLAHVLTMIGTPVRVIEKLHPAESKKAPPACGNNVEWHVLAGAAELLPLLWHCNRIVGMCSKTLLEAAMLGRHPLSYQPQALHPEKCTAVRLGLVSVCMNAAELKHALENPIENAREPVDLFCADPDAAARVLALAKHKNKAEG